jgi:hypothetical protein
VSSPRCVVVAVGTTSPVCMVPIAVTIGCSGQYGFTARRIMYPVALGEFSGHSAAITNFSTLTGVSGTFEVVLRVAIWGSGLRGAVLARYQEAKPRQPCSDRSPGRGGNAASTGSNACRTIGYTVGGRPMASPPPNYATGFAKR